MNNQDSSKYNVSLAVEQVISALKESSSVRSQIYVDPSKPRNEITPIRSIIKSIASIFSPESLKTGGGAKRTIFICKKNESGTTEIIAESDKVKQEILSDFFSSSKCLVDSNHLSAPSYITTDIKIGSGIMGMLAVVSNVENDLDPKDPVLKGLLDLFAEQVATTLLRHRFQSMTTKLFSQVNERVEKRELLNTILEVAAYLLQSSRGGFYEYDQYAETVKLVAPFNQDDAQGRTMAKGKGVAGYIVEKNLDYMIIDDYRTWPNRNDKFGNSPEYAAVLGVLLKRQDESIIGSFSLDCHVERGWDFADAEILRSFRDYVQLAYEQLARIQRLKNIRDAARDIGNLPVVEMSLEAVITSIAKKAGSALKQHLISLLILKEPEVEDATPVIWISATGCNKADNVVKVNAFDLLRNPDTILRKPHRLKEIKLTQIVDDATFRPGDEPVVKYLKEHDIKKVTLVPLRISQTEGFIGVAVIGSRDGDQVIDKHDLILLANQIGTIVSHHQDFKDNINHLGSTAHALRRPLTELLHNAQILQLHEESKEGETHRLNIEEQKCCLKQIIKYTKIQDRHITRILDLAHFRLHDKQIKEDKIKLSGIITKAQNEHEEYAKNNRIKLQLEQLSEINAQEVIGDTTLIQNALDAIIDNAIDTINRRGKEDGCIILREGSNEKYGIIEVEDNGQGIKKEDKSRIFMQGETSKETVGHGMGLPYAIKVVSKQGGKIECDSEVGKGTTFKIFIPLHSPT